ncbi:MAG: OsmC family peroxiredoxin [Haloferacaceae archaeon]|jgi:hypothetical protein
MTNDHRTPHGIDLGAREGFAEHAAERPEAVQLGLGASAAYEGTAAHSLAKVDSTNSAARRSLARRASTRVYGGWKEALDAAGWVGAADRVEPIEAALSALAACINVGITINVVANGVDAEFDRRAGTARPVYTLVSLAQDVEMTVATPTEVAGDNR